MNSLIGKIKNSPMLARVVPFIIFVGITSLQGRFGEASRYWFYLAKTVVGIFFVAAMWPVVTEMRWKFTWEAVMVGVAVCVLWVGLDPFYPKLGAEAKGWNPHEQFGAGSTMAWFFIIARILGSSLIVPPLEEVFYRSFLYRYIVRPDFLSVPFGVFQAVSFTVTAAIFGFGHHEWLAGILCGFAYQALVIYKKRLGDAIAAHAITNFLLGVWIIWRGAWHFW